MDTRVLESMDHRTEKGTKCPESMRPHSTKQLVRMRSPALLYPLFPPARFPVWVSVWVNLRNPICQRHQNIFIIFPIQATRDMSTKDFLLFRSDSAWLNTANGFPWKSKSEKSPLLHPFTITNAASKKPERCARATPLQLKFIIFSRYLLILSA